MRACRPAGNRPAGRRLSFLGASRPAFSSLLRRSGGRKGRPYSGKRNRSVGSANSGAKLEPYQKQILQTQAPSGAGRTRTQALLVLRAGNFLPGLRDNPRNGVRGKRSYGPRRSEVSRTPGEAQRSGFAGKRRSKGAVAVFAVRRKRRQADSR